MYIYFISKIKTIEKLNFNPSNRASFQLLHMKVKITCTLMLIDLKKIIYRTKIDVIIGRS